MKERKRRDLNKEASFASASKGGKRASAGLFVLFAICFSALVLTIGLSNFRLYEGNLKNLKCILNTCNSCFLKSFCSIQV